MEEINLKTYTIGIIENSKITKDDYMKRFLLIDMYKKLRCDLIAIKKNGRLSIVNDMTKTIKGGQNEK